MSLLLLAGLAYGLQPEGWVAFTLFPPWTWGVLGLILLLIGVRRSPKRVAVFLIYGWILFLAVFMEEPRSYLQGILPHLHFSEGFQTPQTLPVRVITLNCALGSAEAASEVEVYHPDVVLLQESPSEAEVRRLQRRLFGGKGGMIWSSENSMLSRGSIQRVSILAARGLHARVHLPNGPTLEVVSLHLPTPPVRLDLWNPACWRDQTEILHQQKRVMGKIEAEIAAIPESRPILLGGDFNASPRSSVTNGLAPRLRDAFRMAGKGWGDTIMNDFPILRIDQVWVSDDFQPVSVRAVKTQHSDHRMVVCDLQIPPFHG